MPNHEERALAVRMSNRDANARAIHVQAQDKVTNFGQHGGELGSTGSEKLAHPAGVH